MLVFLVLGDAKLLSFASGDAKVPDARYFAFWWNIGLKVDNFVKYCHISLNIHIEHTKAPLRADLPRAGSLSCVINGIFCYKINQCVVSTDVDNKLTN